MEIVGYCTIKKEATTGIGLQLETFIGKDVRVLEFGFDGCVLVLNPQATAIATFDKQDIYRQFKCKVFADVLCPSDMDLTNQMLYSMKVISRKGGYNTLVKNMVIQASLMKGKLTDSFLFSKQNEEEKQKQEQ